MGWILKFLAGLIPLAQRFLDWRLRGDDRNRSAARTDALTEDLDEMDEAIADGDLRTIGSKLDELEDPRPDTRGL